MSKLRILIRLASLPVLLLTACASPSGRVPAVDDIMRAWSPELGRRPDPVALAHGRTIYLTSCARCHSPQPISRYDAGTWEKKLPQMIDDANLDLADEDALRAYLEAALKAPDTRGADAGS